MTLTEAVLLFLCRTADPSCVATVRQYAPMVADLAGAYGVDPVLAVSVCVQESRLLTRRAMSLCGTGRAEPETSATIAADALSAHHHHCRTWDAALRSYYYNGRCESTDPHGYVREVRSIERSLRCAMARGRRC